MSMHRREMRRSGNQSIVINATNLGRVLDGIGTYTLSLLRELALLQTPLHFILYVNRASWEHLASIRFPGNCEVRQVSHLLSPDYRFRGHLLSLLFANFLSYKHPTSLIFATSQLEAAFFRTNQILTIHDVTPLLFKKHHTKQYYFYKYVLRRILRGVRGVITPSQHTKQQLVRLLGVPAANISVIHNGVQQAFLSARTQTEPIPEQFILSIGRIVWIKNIVGLLRAFSLLAPRFPHKLVIVGDCPTSASRHFTAAALQGFGIAPDRVIFRWHIATPEIVNLYTKASALVFPSFHEGFGLPPLEGMSCGCPVVVSNVGSLREVCGDAAVYVDPHDPRSIAEGIQAVLTDESLREDKVDKGRERARLFSWRDSAREHVRVFSQALSAGNAQTRYTVPTKPALGGMAYPVMKKASW